MLNHSRLLASTTIHPCYELSSLAKRSHRSSREWTDTLNRLLSLKGPYGTGKEIACTVYGLSRVPSFVRDRVTGLDQLTESFVKKSISSLSHEMNETSIAISALSIHRLASSLPHTLVYQFGESLCNLNKSRWSDPRNLAQVCYTMGSLPHIPNRIRSESLSTWVTSAILSFPPSRFKVKDLVQILTGFSSCRVRNDLVLSHIENAIIRHQLQYCDPLAIGAICLSFSKLEFQVSRETVAGLLATVAQQTHLINAQSLFGIVKGLSCQPLGEPEQEILRQILHASLERVGQDIPLVLWGEFVNSCKKFANEDTRQLIQRHIPKFDSTIVRNNISACADIVLVCDGLGFDATNLVDLLIENCSWDELGRTEIKILTIVSKYRHGTFSVLIKNHREGLVSKCTRLPILLELLNILSTFSSDIDQQVFQSIVDRLCDFPTELTENDLGRIGFQVWSKTGQIPPEIKSRISLTCQDDLAAWVRNSEPMKADFPTKMYCLGKGLCDPTFAVFPNPPVISPVIPDCAIVQLHKVIDSIDPLFLRIHTHVSWVPILSNNPSILDYIRAYNHLQNSPHQFIVFVPSDTSFDTTHVADTMRFIASQ